MSHCPDRVQASPNRTTMHTLESPCGRSRVEPIPLSIVLCFMYPTDMNLSTFRRNSIPDIFMHMMPLAHCYPREGRPRTSGRHDLAVTHCISI